MSFTEFCRALQVEAQALQTALERFQSQPALAESITQSIDLVFARTQAGGKVITLGVGKSGKIAAKFAATLSSTGTPAIYLHPTEAMHGDLGVLHPQDTVIALSHTGNTEELLSVLPFFEVRHIPVISITGGNHSKLASKSKFVIDSTVSEEACPHHLAPTSSTTLALAITDALAMALMKVRGFSPEDFAKNHPGGSLGRRLQLRVLDLMKPIAQCGQVLPSATMEEVLTVSTQYRHGAVLVIQNQKLLGIITDGDIRRALQHREKFFAMQAKQIMTAQPITIAANTLAFDALRLMEERENQISVLPVVSGSSQGHQQGDALGLLRIHDLVQTL